MKSMKDIRSTVNLQEAAKRGKSVKMSTDMTDITPLELDDIVRKAAGLPRKDPIFVDRPIIIDRKLYEPSTHRHLGFRKNLHHYVHLTYDGTTYLIYMIYVGLDQRGVTCKVVLRSSTDVIEDAIQEFEQTR
jgi:hypothetical protein